MSTHLIVGQHARSRDRGGGREPSHVHIVDRNGRCRQGDGGPGSKTVASDFVIEAVSFANACRRVHKAAVTLLSHSAVQRVRDGRNCGLSAARNNVVRQNC